MQIPEKWLLAPLPCLLCKELKKARTLYLWVFSRENVRYWRVEMLIKKHDIPLVYLSFTVSVSVIHLHQVEWEEMSSRKFFLLGHPPSASKSFSLKSALASTFVPRLFKKFQLLLLNNKWNLIQGNTNREPFGIDQIGWSLFPQFQVMLPYSWEFSALFYFWYSWHKFPCHEICWRNQRVFCEELHNFGLNECRRTAGNEI